jgi:predicted glycosyltransferase
MDRRLAAADFPKVNAVTIVLYCQYVWGMGHLFRSVELARALSDHRVVLVAGGQEVAVDLPGHVELVRLPALFMDEHFTSLIPGVGGRSVEAIQRQRREALAALFERARPEVFIVELYPFGRTAFGFELEPLLAAIRRNVYGRVRTVCSIRDVLVEKRDPRAYEARVVDALNRWFDLLLIHSDERLLPLDDTFSRIGDIRVPKVYTGFVAARPEPEKGRELRRDLGLPSGQKLVVASCGGGRAGYRLLKTVLTACRQLQGRLGVRLALFTGPFMADEEFNDLQAMAGDGLVVQRFTPRFLDYLSAADLSISLAGYNTCMNLLATGVPALVLPYARQREQPLRLERLKPCLPLRVLNEDDLEPERLAPVIESGLQLQRRLGPPPVNLDGATRTARYLENWSDGHHPSI